MEKSLDHLYRTKAELSHNHDGAQITGTVPNADTLDGKHATDFATASHTHDGAQVTGTVPNADTVDGKHASDFAAVNHTHDISQASVKNAVNADNANNADTVDGKHATDFATVDHTHASVPNALYAATAPWTGISGKPNTLTGYGITDAAKLDASGKLSLNVIPDVARQQTYVVSNSAARSALTNLISGDSCYETVTGDLYVWDGLVWLKAVDADLANASLNWANLTNKPTTLAGYGITDAAALNHNHTASAISSSATGDVTSTNVQGAIAELAAEKLALANPVAGATAYHYRDVASFSDYSNPLTGIIKILLPVTWKDTMLRIRILGFNYITNASHWETTVSGYSNTTGYWNNTSVTLSPNCPFSSVRLAYDSVAEKCCILLGTTTTTWLYPKLVVEVLAGHSNPSLYASGWVISAITSETGITSINMPATKTLATVENTAPDGYGLGGYATQVTDANNALLSGWYYIFGYASGGLNIPTETSNTSAIIFVEALNANNIKQTLFNRNQGTMYIRHCSTGTWTAWRQIALTDSPAFTGSVTMAGTLAVTGALTASGGVVGNLTGVASSAAKLQTARTINGVSFDGSANITVADSTKLPTSGGTLSGQVVITKAIGTASTYATAQLQINAANGTDDATLGFHRPGATACALKHRGDGLLLHNTAEGYATFKAGNIYSNDVQVATVNQIPTSLPANGGTATSANSANIALTAYNIPAYDVGGNIWVSTSTGDDDPNYDAGHSFTANGYQKLSNGLIIQWGTTPSTAGNNTATSNVTFPIAFPNACFVVTMPTGQHTRSGTAEANNTVVSKTTTGFGFQSGYAYASTQAMYIAIGC